MKESLIKKFKALQRTKNDSLRLLNELTAEQLNQPGENNKWSIAQILFHLYLSEKLTLQYIQKKTLDISMLKRSGTGEWLRSFLLKVSLALPIKYKAPKRIAESIPEEIDWPRLLKDWGQLRDELYKFINQLPEETLPLALFRHPKVGMLNMAQTLDFFGWHLNHHLPQIKNHLSATQST